MMSVEDTTPTGSKILILFLNTVGFICAALWTYLFIFEPEQVDERIILFLTASVCFLKADVEKIKNKIGIE